MTEMSPLTATAPQTAAPALAIRNLDVALALGHGRTVKVIESIDLAVHPGEMLAVVGESGCGKSMLSLAVMGLLPANGRIARGEILLQGEDISAADEARMRHIRGKRIAMIFQEPMTSLNPLFSIGRQLAEAYLAHFPSPGRQELRERIVAALRQVRIPSPERRIDEFPHQLSGGMRQRVMIAMALLCEPDILIADEPTTALDVTVQAQILGLLRDLIATRSMAIVLITHDLGVVAQTADKVAVMYSGRIVEYGPTAVVFADAQHPYTLGLMSSIPRLDRADERLVAIEGMVPRLDSRPQGCAFAPRCPFADAACEIAPPVPRRFDGDHIAACIHAPVEETAA